MPLAGHSVLESAQLPKPMLYDREKPWKAKALKTHKIISYYLWIAFCIFFSILHPLIHPNL
jgi:hypothetical protein